MKCPCCGEEHDDTPYPLQAAKDPLDECSSPLGLHVFYAHGWGAMCWCGSRDVLPLRKHILANGGYEAHWMDYLMGVSDANQTG